MEPTTDLAHSPTHESKEQISFPKVRSVTPEEYGKLTKKHQLELSVGTNEISEVEPQQVVANEGAGPCLIMWEFNLKTGAMVRTAHTAEVDSKKGAGFERERLDSVGKKYQEEDPKGIVVPEGEQLKTLGLQIKNITPKGLEIFSKMNRGVAEDVKEAGRDNIGLFLFGQNAVLYGDKMERKRLIVESSLHHFNSLTDIRQATGLNESHIHDLRTPNDDGVDYTMYVPSENVLYHCHLKKDEQMPDSVYENRHKENLR